MTTRELLHDALALTEHSFANENPKYIKKQKNKILFHTLLNIPFAKKWFSLIQSEEYKWILLHRPRFYFKPFRVYMSTTNEGFAELLCLHQGTSFAKTYG